MDLAAVRRALCTQASSALPELNVYPYPDPQPEYPAMMVDTLDFVTFHAAQGCDGAIVQLTAMLLVAEADLSSSHETLESLIPLALVLEQAEDPAFVNVVATQASNVRQIDQGQALACDLTVTVHV